MNNEWIEQRWLTLQQAQCIVVKVGSAVLTSQNGLDIPILQNLVSQLVFIRSLPHLKGNLRKIILVSSGAVAAGKAILHNVSKHIQPDMQHLVAKQAIAAIGQSRLMQQYDTAFGNHNVGTAQVLLTRDVVNSRQRFLNARNTFTKLLDWDIVPVVNENDTICVQELKFGDNDCLSSLLINLIGADLFINLTSAPGVLDKKPELGQETNVIPHINNIHDLDLANLCGAKSAVGSGGMYSKLLAARRTAQLGVPTLILPGKEHDIMRQVFSNKDFIQNKHSGTWISADKQTISRRKFWMAYQSDPSGVVYIDAGAVEALKDKGSSLLPGGICNIEGNFRQGALVRIVNQNDNGQINIGVGLSNYAASDIKKIMGRKRHEVAAILSDAHYAEVIHRDNILLDAAF